MAIAVIKELMKELNQKLAEWAGFQKQTLGDLPPSYRHEGNLGWEYPTDSIGVADKRKGLPNFTDSLDACLKWLVPKSNGCSLYQYKNEWRAGVGYTSKSGGAEYYDKDPVIALCKAIEKLIDSETK